MTVSATTTRNDYIATAGQTVFPYTFKVLDSTDLVVTKNGVVQSAYSVSGINVVTGGNVTFTSGVTANDAIAIYLAMPVTRDTNYQEGGAFLAGEVNSDFDKIYIGAIQNENAIDRSMRLPESEPTVSMTLPSKADRLGTVLGFNAVTGAPEAGPTIVAAGTIASIAADIETVAGISSDVVVVSGLQGNINNLGPISQDIISVSGISSDVTALNTDPLKSNINTVAGISSDVTGVSGISAAVTAVNNSASTIASVNANLPKISIVAASDAEVTIVADNIADVVNVNADLTGDDTIGTVAGAIANVNTVGGNITNVNTVAGDTSAINAVNANAANINAVSANGTNISTVAGDTTAINSVAGAIPAITAVNTDPLKTNIANVNANSSNITAVANNAANINNVANNSASINTVAADGADIGTVAGISADVSSVANIAPNVTTVSGMETKIDTVIADAADIGTVAVNIGSVTTVAGISGDVTTVSGISTDVTSVADNMTAVQNAVTSATNAAASASSASTSASSAATSESNAAISAGNAATSASNAATSASNASASSASASNSANVASNASTSAASSAASAGSSDTNAAASAANAAASAVNASNSEIAAASSATDSSVAASTWNSYYSTYLGAAASAPSTDLLGQSLQNGALYFNTTDDTMYVFNGTTWIAAESTINNVDWGGQLAGNLNTNGYDINFGDNDKAQFGAGNDLQIYHDGSGSYVSDTGAGPLRLQGSGVRIVGTGGENLLIANEAAEVTLLHNNAAKLATTATGIDVTGTATMDGLTVDVGGITQLSNIARIGDNSAVADLTLNSSDSSVGTINFADASDSNVGRIQYNHVDNTMILRAADATRVLVSSTGIDVTGTATMDGLTFGANNRIQGTGMLFVGGAAATVFEVGAGSEKMRLTSTGLGIGTSSPEKAIHVKTAVNNTAVVRIESTAANSYPTLSLKNDAREYQLTAHGPLGDKFTIYDGTAGSHRFVIDSAGQVGIGTSTPSRTLDVSKSVGSIIANFKNTGGTSSFITLGNTSSTADQIRVGSNGTAFTVSTNYAERMRIDNAGRIGIGTSSPSSLLQLFGSPVATSGALATFRNSDATAINTSFGGVLFNSSPGTDYSIGKSNVNAVTTLSFRNGNTGVSYMDISSAGRVGIGTSSPATNLEVEGDSGAATGTVSAPVAIRITDTSNIGSGGDITNPYAALQFFGRDTSNEGPTVHAQIGTIYDDQFGAGSHLTFSTWNSGIASAAERMRIDSSGNLLSGTTVIAVAQGVTTGVSIRGPIGRVEASADGTTSAIFNRLNSDGAILNLAKNGATVGSIGAYFGDLFIASPSSTDAGLGFGGSKISPVTTTGATRDNAIDLGGSAARFKDLYLSGGVYLGGTGAANHLDDYEEGTWTPTVTSGTFTLSNASYTKVGRLVTVFVRLELTGTRGGEFFQIGGLPFTQSASKNSASPIIAKIYTGGSSHLNALSIGGVAYFVVQEGGSDAIGTDFGNGYFITSFSYEV